MSNLSDDTSGPGIGGTEGATYAWVGGERKSIALKARD